MEPKLCFILCETPIIYIKNNICRCSAGGLMVHNRADCDDKEAYSVYVDDEFYSEHARLFNYQIQFISCELWNRPNVYNTLQVKIDQLSAKSPLNQLEQCAATCLDRNASTQSIAFNGDNKQCLCILSEDFNNNNTFHSTVLSNDSCNRYCDNRLHDSNVKNKFKCGSSTDSRILAIYSLNQTCPIDSFYIEELKQCILPYRGSLDSCPSKFVDYLYDGKVKWNSFLKTIKKLNLITYDIAIYIDVNVTVNPSWKCRTTKFANIDDFSGYGSTLHTENNNKHYILDRTQLCLRSSSLTSFSWVPNRLCIPYRVYDVSSSHYLIDYSFSGGSVDRAWFKCPRHWLDINKNCYRISNERKTIQEARNRCIYFSQDEITNAQTLFTSQYTSYGNVMNDDDDDDNNEKVNISKAIMSDALKGELVQYTSQWEARLGFFLLDEISNDNHSLSPVNEFQMLIGKEENNSCLVVARTIRNKNESLNSVNTQIKNCSKLSHVLCQTKPMLDLSFKIGCFTNPLTLDLPAMISNHLTYELCLSVCQNLKITLAIININKCYCLNVDKTHVQQLKSNHTKFLTKNCGNPCSGNQNEQCGNMNASIVLREGDTPAYGIRIVETNEQDKTYPNFVYHDCIDLSSVNKSEIYAFNLTHSNDVHPRYCVELCTTYQQRYSLLNSNRCLCTNMPMKKLKDNLFASSVTDESKGNNNCRQECPGNYFYSCGNTNNSNIYSVYVVRLQCPFGFQSIEGNQQCVYKDFSKKTYSFVTAQSYCKSIGGTLAKIDDILEVQTIVPQSILNEKTLRGSYSSYGGSLTVVQTPKYFWIDRTLAIANNNNNNKKSDYSIERCFQTSKSIDQNCIVLRQEKIMLDNMLTNQWCFTESDQCSSISAMPICIDKPTKFPPRRISDSSIISINITTDYSCENDQDYHFIDGYCYRVSYHETTWHDAKLECERENARLFVPEKVTILPLIKALFLRHHSYTSSGFVHVGLFYDNQTRSLTNTSYIYEFDNICKRKVNERFEELISSPKFSNYAKNRSVNQQIKCAYISFRGGNELSISCNAMSCNRLATVICQKSPLVTARTLHAKIDSTNFPMHDKSNLTSKSIGKTFITILLLLTILFVLIIIGLVYTLRRLYFKQTDNNRHPIERFNSECIYSKLLIKNESDPN